MFAKRIKELRQQRDLTQAALGKMVNVKKQTVTNWEAGNNYPNSDTLIKLTQVFNVSSDYLLGIDDETKAKQLNLAEIFKNPHSQKALDLYQKMLDAGMSEDEIDNYIAITIAVTKRTAP